VLVPAGAEGGEVPEAGAVDLLDPGSQPGESLFTFVAVELPPPGRWRWLIRVIVTTIPARAGRREFGELGRESGDLLVEAIE